MRNPFEAGDLLKHVDNFIAYSTDCCLTIGQIYIALPWLPTDKRDYVYVLNDRGKRSGGWDTGRFQRVGQVDSFDATSQVNVHEDNYASVILRLEARIRTLERRLKRTVEFARENAPPKLATPSQLLINDECW